MRTNCTPHTQPGRGMVIIAPPTVRYSEQILYAALLRRASHCVRYPEFGGCLLFGCFYCIICMETAVGACNSVHYSVDVRYWDCPLIESPLYIHKNVYRSFVYTLSTLQEVDLATCVMSNTFMYMASQIFHYISHCHA